MDWIAELLGRRSVGIVRPEIHVLRLVPIGAPVALVFAGIGIVDDYSMVSVAIRHVDLIRVLIDKDLCGKTQVLHVVAAFTRARFSDLHQQLSILREFHHHAVVKVAQGAASLAFIRRLALNLSTAATSSSLIWRCAPSIASDPYITFVIDGDAVIRFGPLVA